MNKRFCKLGRNAAKAFFLLAVCGSTFSCKDDYLLDDSDPDWLGSSIYDYLNTEGNYKNFVKLIEDLDYKEVLQRTGSKTLFVANDEAFDEFYKSNAWGVRSYSELTKSQKKLLLNNAMINNAYLLEMMSSTAAVDETGPVKGQCLRRETASDVTDSIPHLFADDLPVSYNEHDKDYWARFRNNDKGIYLAMDATSPMITHFLAAQMANRNITDDDFEKITGKKREKSDAFIYDSKVMKQDVTCQNGYINVLDKVLLNPQNMAEVLRTNSDTKIFSHMLDRFSAPFYNSTLTERAKLLYGNQVDSVYEKRYFSIHSKGYNSLFSDAGTDPIGNPSGNTVFDNGSNKPLPFDPGWNTFQTDDKTQKEQDMGVIFCPNDNKFMEYFFSENGGGRFLVKAYAPEYLSQITPATTDLELVFKAIDQIPRKTIRALLNNLMKISFNNSVPSKFIGIKNSALDAMFDEKANYHTDYIEKTLLANNGIIYVMNEVTTPAEYAAVCAPAYVETDKQIFNYAVQAPSLGGIPTNYSAYLLAMSSRFSFFVPCDENFWYIDPMSFRTPEISGSGENMTLVGRAYNLTWDSKNGVPKGSAYEYNYNIKTGTGAIGNLLANESVTSTCYGNRLKDMLETHTIIHEDNTGTTGIDETETGVECDQHYFISKNGVPVYVENAKQRKDGMKIIGGWGLNNNTKNTVIGFDDKSAQTNGYGNGFAYMIDGPIIPTIESVYSAMYSNPNFSMFFDLCNTQVDVLNEIGINGNAAKKYNIFEDNGGIPCYNRETGAMENSATNVRFFQNYRYTIYVPTNEAIQAAVDKGLPTWEHIREFLQIDLDDNDPNKISYGDNPEDRAKLEERNTKAQAMVNAIINFVKYHFQDNSIFADIPAIKQTPYETATLNPETGVYYKVYVSSEGNGNLNVRDLMGNVCHITNDKNIIVRDYISNKGKNAVSTTITASSSAVLHGIDGVLNYKPLTGGRYDSDWATAAKARAYINKYRVTEK